MRKDGASLSHNAIACLMAQVADAVAALNRVGIVHRDVKFENILLVQDEATGCIQTKVGLAQRV